MADTELGTEGTPKSGAEQDSRRLAADVSVDEYEDIASGLTGLWRIDNLAECIRRTLRVVVHSRPTQAAIRNDAALAIMPPVEDR